jgi:nucleoside 2-deoxyribosyltransferase
MKLVYVAGPYRRTDTTSQERNITDAEGIALAVVNATAVYGWFPVTPHLNTRDFDLMVPAMSSDYWLDGTREILAKCDAVLLTRPDAVEVSAGTANEVAYAQSLGIPVYTKFDDFVEAASQDPKQPGYFNSCSGTRA